MLEWDFGAGDRIWIPPLMHDSTNHLTLCSAQYTAKPHALYKYIALVTLHLRFQFIY